MESRDSAGFLNVSRLLESSRPTARVRPGWWIIGLFFAALIGGSMLGGQSAAARAVAVPIWAVLTILAVAGMSAMSVRTVRAFRADQMRVERIGDLTQLRRYPEAAVALDQYLSAPARTHAFRAQALVYLSSVLARMNRFDDAILVQDRLLEEGLLDETSSAAVRMSRAMAMLREDHLFDADRAISELRRGVVAGSAAVALIEIYRDVKTGHPAEAVELFERKLPELRDRLGHRVADAHALAARAYDLLGRENDAARAWRNATLLAPAVELFRRYPEVTKLAGRFAPAPAPPEAA